MNTFNLSGFGSFVTRPFMFMISLSCMFASMVLTIAFIIMNQKIPEFFPGWYYQSIACWSFIALLVLGATVTVVQSAALVALKRSQESWYTLTNLGYFFMWAISLILSVYITILTLHSGLAQGALNAKTESKAYQNLLDRRETISDSLKEQERQQKELFNKGWYTKGDQWYGAKLDILQGQLRVVDEKIENYDHDQRDEYTSGSDAYGSLAKDFSLIFNFTGDRSRLTLILMYFYLIAMALALDLGGSLLMMYACSPIEDHTVSMRKGKNLALPSKATNFQNMDAEEIRLMLPGMPMVIDLMNTYATRIIFVGPTDSGKTTTLLAFLNKMAHKMVRNNVKLYIVDPKPVNESNWPKWATAIIGRGFKLEDIKNFLEWMKHYVYNVRGKMTTAEVAREPEIVVIIDEMFQLTQDFKSQFKINFSSYWMYFTSYARTLKVYFYGATQIDSVKALGIEGVGDIRGGFTVTLDCLKEGLTRYPFYYVIASRAKQKPRLLQAPKVSRLKKLPFSKSVKMIASTISGSINHLLMQKGENNVYEWQKPIDTEYEVEGGKDEFTLGEKSDNVIELKQRAKDEDDKIIYDDFKYLKTVGDAKAIMKAYDGLERKSVTAAVEAAGKSKNGLILKEAKVVIKDHIKRRTN